MPTREYTRIAVAGIMCVLVLLSLLGGAFLMGHRIGKQQGLRQAAQMMGMPLPSGNPAEMRGHVSRGQIVSVEGDRVVVEAPDGSQRNLVLSASTLIRSPHGRLTAEDLRTGDRVIAIGNPDQNGDINVTLLRLPERKPGGR